MNALRGGIAAIAFALAATTASAATLTSLVAGGTLSAGGIIFDSFSYTDIGAGFGAPFITISSSDIFLTASSVGNTVTLSFDFSPSISLTTFQAYELAGFFLATATGGVMTSVDIMMGGQTLTGDSLLGHSLADGGTLLAETELGSGFFAPGGSTGPATLANLTSLLFGWASSGETDDYIFAGGAGPGTLSTDGFSIVFTVVPNQVPQVPQVPIVPLPASLPLLLAAVFGLGLVRRRRRAA